MQYTLERSGAFTPHACVFYSCTPGSPTWRLYSDTQQFLSCHGTQEKDQFRLMFEPWLLCASTQSLDKTVTWVIVFINHAVEFMMPLWILNGIGCTRWHSQHVAHLNRGCFYPARQNGRWFLLPPGCPISWLISWRSGSKTFACFSLFWYLPLEPLDCHQWLCSP